MPDPIQSSGNSSVYDPSEQMSKADECDPSTTTCGSPPKACSNVVTVEPVVIDGDAGVQALLRRHALDQCLDQKGDAERACGVAALTTAKTLLTATTGIGLSVALVDAGLVTFSIENCAEEVSAYQACVDREQAREVAAAKCEADGGVFLDGGRANELVCLVPPSSR